MFMLCLFLFSLSTAVIACIAMFTALFFVKRHAAGVLREDVESLTASSGLQGPQFEEQIGAMLDKRLDKMVAAFKAKIPLAGMFLSKDKEESLKQLARGELMELAPLLKEKVLSGNALNANGGAVATVMDNVLKKLFCRLGASCALAGFILGAVQFGILHLLGIRFYL